MSIKEVSRASSLYQAECGTLKNENFAGSFFLQILRIDLDPQKLVPTEEKTPQKLRPFSQINFSTVIDFCMPLGRYTLVLNKNVNIIFCWKKHLELRYIR